MESISSWNLGIAYEKVGEIAKAIDLLQMRVNFEHAINHPDLENHVAKIEDLRVQLANQ